jgi:hypothetical protein
MQYDFGGEPVIGGSYPAEIFHDFVVGADSVVDERLAAKAEREGKTYTPPEDSSGGGSQGVTESGSGGGGDTSGSGGTGGDTGAGGTTGGGDTVAAGRPAAATRAAAEATPAGVAAATPVVAAAIPAAGRAPAAAPRRHSCALPQAGRGRETNRLPAALKRHGRSAALVIPIAGPAASRGRSSVRRRAEQADRPGREVGAVELQSDAQRLRQLARARAQVLDGLARRAGRASRRPRAAARAPGSARPPRALGLETALSMAWIP